MSVGRTIYCDGPGCGSSDEGGNPRHVYTDTPAPHLSGGFIAVREQGNAGNRIVHHFCGWDCLLKYGSKFPPEERVELRGPEDLDGLEPRG